MTSSAHILDDLGDTSTEAIAAERSRLSGRALVTAVTLGVMGDALLRGGPPGVGFGLWIVTLIAALLSLVWQARGAVPAEGRWLLLLCAAFGASFAVRDSPELGLLNLAGIAGSMALLAAALRAQEGHFLAAARVRDVVWAMVTGGVETALGAFPLLLSDAPLGRMVQHRHGPALLAAIRGAVIAIPLLLVFGGLLMVADPVFGQLIGDLLRVDVEVLASHFVLAGVIGWIVGGFLRTALLAPRPMFALPQGPRVTVGRVEMVVSLGALNVLFLSFVLVQLRYFFGGADVVRLTAGLGYAEYARRGFFELVVVAMLVLPVLLAASALRPPDDERAARTFRRLSTSLVALLFVIMYSALARMRLYTQEYGLSSDRLYATTFMVCLAVVFVLFLVTVARGRGRGFAMGAVATALVGVAAMDVAAPDAFVARFNVNRAEDAARAGRGYRLDAAYLARLGGDAVPEVVRALRSPTLARAALVGTTGDARIAAVDDRCQAAGRLLQRWLRDDMPDWRSWSLARARAVAAVEANEGMLRRVTCWVDGQEVPHGWRGPVRSARPAKPVEQVATPPAAP